jgi:hypothetical protein
MTLRHYLSAILPFGQPVDPDQHVLDFRCLALRRRLLTVWLLSAVWRSRSEKLDSGPMTLRRQVSLVLPFGQPSTLIN